MVIDAKQLVKSDAPIQVMDKVYVACGPGMDMPNPGTSRPRAPSAKQFISAGFKTGDLAYDVEKGFVKVLGEIPKKAKQKHKNTKRGSLRRRNRKPRWSRRYLKILDEYDS